MRTLIAGWVMALAAAAMAQTDERFVAVDTDGDGYISIEEAHAAYPAIHGDQGRDIFRAADKDGDGRVSVGEAGTARSEYLRGHEWAERQYDDEWYTQDRFGEADLNGDGVLSNEEMRNAQKGWEETMDDERLRHADTDGDGQLSYDEAKAEKRWEKDHHRQIEREARQRARGGNDGSADAGKAGRAAAARARAHHAAGRNGGGRGGRGR